MDRWPQRKRFRELVAGYCDRKGLHRRDVAAALNIAESTLHNYLYNRKLAPSSAVLQRASRLFKVSITEFLDDPGLRIPGVSARSTAQGEEADRAILQEVARDLLKLNPPQKGAMLALWRASVRAVKTLGAVGKPKRV